MPKPKDIGLIFDVTLENSNEEDSELLEFRIRANGYCCVNVTPEVLMEKMGRIVGGDFGFIAAGEIEKVSVIWPTVSLFNRVGLCPIAITSTNTASEERTIKEIIKFDTRFEILDPDGHTLRRQKNFIDCQNWDKDYFKNCFPVDCEERYFGLRNFYNFTSEKCEKLPRCSQNYQLYDMFTNECVDTGVICSEEDLRDYKEVEFVNNIGEFKTVSKKQQEIRFQSWTRKLYLYIFSFVVVLLAKDYC
ncbi:uncharacterized protein LOC135949215 [Calliphora vicina]|uniref:uncharacterized protein LOC135949215 n=1 Tax=Calliphora vicina TaxID=7373 RepID=UPI00325B9C2B